MPDSITCPNCHQENSAGSKFCQHCGIVLPVEIPGAVPESEPNIRTEVLSTENDGIEPVRTEQIDFKRAAPETIALPAVPPAVMKFENGFELPLTGKESYRIGRVDPANSWYPEIDLSPLGGEQGGVSRRHGRIVFDGGSFFLEDFKSKNGTYVNDVLVQDRSKISDGDRLRFGRVQGKFLVGT